MSFETKSSKVALEHRIMTQFTSFVAVEETVVTVGGKPTTIAVPVEMPDGVSREGIFGEAKGRARQQYAGGVSFTKQGVPAAPMPAPTTAMRYPEARRFERGAMPLFGLAKRSAAPREQALLEREITHRDASVDKEQLKTAAVRNKLAPELRELLGLKDRPKDYTKGKVTVKDGKITVQVWLTRATDEVVKKLKEAGLEVLFTATTGKMVLGTMDVDRLSKLAEITEVRLIEPAPVG